MKKLILILFILLFCHQTVDASTLIRNATIRNASIRSGIPFVASYILMETGDHILMETADKILLEQ